MIRVRAVVSQQRGHRTQGLCDLVRKEKAENEPSSTFWDSRSFQTSSSVVHGEGPSLASMRNSYHYNFTDLKTEAQVTAERENPALTSKPVPEGKLQQEESKSWGALAYFECQPCGVERRAFAAGNGEVMGCPERKRIVSESLRQNHSSPQMVIYM